MELDYLQALMGGTLEESPSASYRDIWIVAESRRNALAGVTRQMLGRARELAEMLGVHVVTVLAGYNVAPLAADAIAYGSDTVLLADSPLLADYRTETFVPLLAALIQEKKPEIVLLAATAMGRDLAPRLAARLNTGLLTECVSLDLDQSDRVLLADCATHGGMMLASCACPTARPQLATVLPGCLRALARDSQRQGSTESITVPFDDGAILSAIEPAAVARRSEPLADARVIVTGGRGIGGAEDFKLLEELAAALGGEAAATRSAVEFGWAPHKLMVDITGNQVHPALYVAVGVSGAFPHRMATRGVGCLVAINQDRHAPIMRQADYAIVGDWREVVPALILAIKEAKQQ